MFHAIIIIISNVDDYEVFTLDLLLIFFKLIIKRV